MQDTGLVAYGYMHAWGLTQLHGFRLAKDKRHICANSNLTSFQIEAEINCTFNNNRLKKKMLFNILPERKRVQLVITPTCSLGARIKWPLSHWSANLTTWATASYNWCDEAITFIMITSESANAEKIWTYKSQDMWAAKCAANHEFGPISMYKMKGLYS